MKSDGRNRLVKRNYVTEDIAKCVEDVFYRYWHTCRELSEHVRGGSEYETCENIWRYVIDNTRYVEDAKGTQFVKTPARLLDDGYGDCKSMAILCASLATCCGIQCSFRFVSFGSSKVGHVYVVTDSGINIDPVEFFQRSRGFNEVTEFVYKMDRPIKKGLAVLSGVGADGADAAIGASAESYRVWLDGTDVLNNTFAANYLYTAIDLKFSLIEVNGDDIEALNSCDLLLTALLLYNRCSGNEADLRRAGGVLEWMYRNGFFYSTDVDDDARIAHLDNVTSRALELYNSGQQYVYSGSVWDWWKNYVIAADYRQSDDVISGVRNAIGATTQGNNASANLYLDKIKQSGCYFAYDSLSTDVVNRYAKRMPELKRKRAIQKSVRKGWVYGFNNMNLNEAAINNAIMSGQVKDMRASSADEWLEVNAERLRNGEEKIGDLGISAILMIIMIVVTLVGSVLGSVLQYCLGIKALEIEQANNSQAQNLLNATQNYSDGAMEEVDFEGLSGGNSQGSVSDSGLLGGNKGLLIGAAIALFVLKNK